MDSSSTGTGADAVGKFASTTMSWDGGNYVTSVRQYGDAVIFEQTFPNGVSGTTLNAKFVTVSVFACDKSRLICSVKSHLEYEKEGFVAACVRFVPLSLLVLQLCGRGGTRRGPL
jgi:hypothetical protein